MSDKHKLHNINNKFADSLKKLRERKAKLQTEIDEYTKENNLDDLYDMASEMAEERTLADDMTIGVTIPSFLSCSTTYKPLIAGI